MMRYPLDLKFKIAALASQINVTDADGNQIFYVKQKMFKLKENIEIYTDNTKAQLLYTSKADRVIDFSPEFKLCDAAGNTLGSIKRFGGKSILKTTYQLKIGTMELTVKEANPWAKVLDAMLGQIPLLGLVTGYILHPRYQVTDQGGQEVAMLKKLPAFLEGKYSLESETTSLDEGANSIFAALMMIAVLRERFRG